MRVLVVDDERPALDELAYLLGLDARISSVLTADSAAEALRVLQEEQVDAVFSDIRMPGLSGLELAKVLSRFSEPPPVVFVTAHDEHAVDAFELHVVDYVLKPVREDRLAEAVRRLVAEPVKEAPEEQIAGRARRRHPLRPPQRRPVRRGAGRLRPAAHALGQPPPPRPAHDARGAVARLRFRTDPPLPPGLAVLRVRGAHGRRPLLRGGRRGGATGQPPAHQGVARRTRPPGSTMTSPHETARSAHAFAGAPR